MNYIKYHGHSCFEVGGSLVILFDPHDGKSIGLPVPDARADFVFITHEHFDHNAVHVVRGLPKVVRDDCNGSFKNLKYQCVRDYHDESGGAERGMVRIFRVELDGISFAHLGDLGRIPDREKIDFIKNVDFLFIPVGSVYTIDSFKAFEIVKMVEPRITVPMHFSTKGLKLNLEPVENFLKHFEKEKVKKQGREKRFNRDELPKEKEVWVFSL
ncbi:MAG: MBL fold metallo-hydrolase [Thermoplasmata archaeon]